MKREQDTTDDTQLFADAIGEVLFLEEASIRTFADWKKYVHSKQFLRPPVPTPKQWETMNDAQKMASRENRSKYNAALDPILTSSRIDIRNDILRLISANRKSKDSARLAGVLKGFPTVGKTTLAKYIGKQYEIACRNLLFSGYGQRDTVPQTNSRYIPVVYISLRGQKQREKVSLSGFLKKLARFYGIPNQRDEDQLIETIIDMACACQTSLIIIDEMSNLDLRFVGSKTIVDTIKDLMNHINATFLFVGIADKIDHIFAGFDAQEIEEIEVTTQATKSSKVKTVRQKRIKQSSQMNHRLIEYDLHPQNKAHGLAEEAEAIIIEIDKEITLIHHEVGDLEKLASHIMLRTNGYVGAIVALIRLACEKAIFRDPKEEDEAKKFPEENITKALLDTIKISRAAEVFAQRQAG
jgi:hypothetical protein